MATLSGAVQGTTPTIVFNLPFEVSTIENCEIYFGQNDELLLTKGYNDCILSGTTMTVRLFQSDTLQFDPEEKLQIQARFRYSDGTTEATNITKIKVGDLLSEAVISRDRSAAQERDE